MQASPRRSKGEISRDRILNAAARAIRRDGHNGASVADVMKEAGLKHGGFYAHFCSRDEMVAGAIAFAGKESGDKVRKSIARLQKKGMSPLRALIDSYLSVAHMAAIETGCAVAALGSEMSRQSGPVRKAASEQVQALVRLIESVLPDRVDRASASHITSTMVGALQMARVLGGKEGKVLLEMNRTALLERYD